MNTELKSTTGKVQPIRLQDAAAGHEFEITVSELYTVIIINGRSYYFNAEDGSFDGMSTDCVLEG